MKPPPPPIEEPIFLCIGFSGGGSCSVILVNIPEIEVLAAKRKEKRKERRKSAMFSSLLCFCQVRDEPFSLAPVSFPTSQIDSCDTSGYPILSF